LRRSIAAAWTSDKIISGIPNDVEQIHARQILLTDEQTALAVKSQLDSGADFTNLAYQYDPVAGGDLGWFPRNFLNVPEVEQAIFAIETGNYTEVIRSTIGWHIILVIDRDPSRSLSPDALLSLQHQAISQWLAERRTESTIEILI
jgi:parvulin-like peptidyl-prolyl isomerase